MVFDNCCQAFHYWLWLVCGITYGSQDVEWPERGAQRDYLFADCFNAYHFSNRKKNKAQLNPSKSILDLKNKEIVWGWQGWQWEKYTSFSLNGPHFVLMLTHWVYKATASRSVTSNVLSKYEARTCHGRPLCVVVVSLQLISKSGTCSWKHIQVLPRFCL